MTEAQLLTALATKYDEVVTSLKKAIGNKEADIQMYAVPVYDVDGDIRKRIWIHYYIKDTDVAYWVDREPKVTPPTTFRDELQTYLNTLIGDPLESVYIDRIDSINETSVVTGYFDNSGIIEQHRIVDKGGAGGTFQHRLIT